MDRNLLLALVLSMVVLFGYQEFFVKPKTEAWQAAQAEADATAAEQGGVTDSTDALFSAPTTALSREEALTKGPGRVPIRTSKLSGSINLQGLLFDDLVLLDYAETMEPDSPNIVLLSPRTAPEAQFMRAGMRIQTDLASAGDVGNNAIWSAPEGAELTPTTPVTFTRSVDGVDLQVTVSVDDQYMFQMTQRVTNNSDNPIRATPLGASFQKGVPSDLVNFMILFEGPMAVVNEVNRDRLARKYKKILNQGGLTQNGQGGWVGISGKYWLSAVIPPQDAAFVANIAATNDATPIFTSSYTLDAVSLQPGESMETTSMLYGGSKKVRVLRAYEKNLGIERFDWAVDWGNFSFLTRPIFNTLSFFHGWAGNWGVAILLLTVLIKAILFPLANMSYKAMAGMKMVQPELKKVQERYKDDKPKLQQEMMALYKKHKINPAAGCLPIIPQMIIFYALYKTLFVTLELRHQGFLYISDLSERDPTSIFNLFGLIPYDPLSVPVIGGLLGLGVLPLLMGAAMFVQTKLNPPPPDPTQRMIFALMPLIFMFIFAPFAAGLVLYWFWNTFLSVIQQYVIMKRQGADVDILGNIKMSFGNKDEAANENKAK